MDTHYPISPTTRALIDLLAAWPRGRIAKHLQRHADPTAFLLSGELRANLQREAAVSAAMQTKRRDANRLPRASNGPRNADFVLGTLDSAYPDILRQIPDPPLVVYGCGNPALLGRPAVAVVGARRCTAQGSENAHMLARQFATAGIAVVSGLALGIDAAAHRGVLAANAPRAATIAVLGAGLHHLYPARHAGLARQLIRAGGLLLTEYAPDEPPLAHHFPERNRIISGLSVATVVVEATVKSGSLITARFAAEQGREVYAMPGPVHNAMSEGCHRLIQQGAGLVLSATDVLLDLGWEGVAASRRGAAHELAPPPDLPDEAQHLLELIHGYPVSLDELVLGSGIEPSRVTSLLIELEMAGIVQQGTLGYSRASTL